MPRLASIPPSRRAAAPLLAALLAACAGHASAPHAPGRVEAPAVAHDSAGHPLAGRVRDDRTDAPVPEAFVLLLADTAPGARPLRAGRTDARGIYRLAGAPAGRYFVRIQRIGYFTETRAVQLGDCGVMVVSGSHVSFCGDTRHFYVRSLARF
jgi:hypothetical protein